MAKKVLITSRSFGQIDNVPIKTLEDAGYEITLKGKDFDQDEFDAIVKDFDALIIGVHKFSAEVMAGCKNLKIICKHGAGLDNIPMETATNMGISVCNVPSTNSNAVADLAFGLLIASARNILPVANNVKNGQWKTSIGCDVYAKTLGLLGFGAIAKNVARRAGGFSMKVLVYDPYVQQVPTEFENYVTLASFDEVIRSSDFISVHIPLTDETRDIINKDQMAQMKDGAYIINTARGGIVNEKDLYDMIVSKKLSGAALDVTVNEPIEADSPLLSLDNVIITSHIGMYSKEAIGAVSLTCAKNVAALANGEKLINKVN